MSILSQLGVVILIAFISFIIVKANKDINNVNEEGEHFVDEWELRQQKKELRLQQKQEEKERKELNRGKEKTEETAYPDEYTEGAGEAYPDESGEASGEAHQDNVISMNHYKNTGIILVERNEQHEPVRRINVNQLPFLIGRDTDNHLVLNDLCVAKRHCRIVEEAGQYILEDVGTKNKLFVNGMVTDRAVLSDHLRFFIGNVEFAVEMGMQRSGSTRIHQGMREKYYE